MINVVFDTNAYRNLTYGKEIKTIRKELDAITSAEESKGFQVFMAPVPWIELYSHLANPDDLAFDQCLNAVVASYVHTRIDCRTNIPKLIPQYLMVVARLLFQYKDLQEDKILLYLNEMAARINATPTKKTVLANLEDFIYVQEFIEKTEQEFIENFTAIQNQFHLRDSNSKKDIKNLLSQEDLLSKWMEKIVTDAFQLCQNNNMSHLSKEELVKKTSIFKQYFTTPFYLVKHILTQLITNKEFNIRGGSRRNWVWDYQMLFYISTKQPFFLVTGDKNMRQAAEAAGVENRIVSLDSYLKLLHLNIPFEKKQSPATY